MEPLFKVSNLVKNYQSERQNLPILKSLNFEVSKKTTVCIMGPSGSGKSTLLNLLGALDTPNSGEILYQGKNINQWSDQEKAFFRREKLGFVFQFHHLLKELNLLENIQLPALIAKKDKKSSLKRAEQLIEAIGLQDRKAHFPSQLSGGESQRVAVARALMNQPELILADEPIGNLDRNNGIKIKKLLFELQEQFQMSLIAVSHDRFFSEAFSSVLKLEDGQLQKL